MIVSIAHKKSFENDVTTILGGLSDPAAITALTDIQTQYTTITTTLSIKYSESFPTDTTVFGGPGPALTDDQITIIDYYDITNLGDMQLLIDLANYVNVYNSIDPTLYFIDCKVIYTSSSPTLIQCKPRFFHRILIHTKLLKILNPTVANLLYDIKLNKVFETYTSGSVSTYTYKYPDPTDPLSSNITIQEQSGVYFIEFSDKTVETEICTIFDILSELINCAWR